MPFTGCGTLLGPRGAPFAISFQAISTNTDLLFPNTSLKKSWSRHPAGAGYIVRIPLAKSMRARPWPAITVPAAMSVDPGCILITPGTSLSYWYCFKLLADEGDEILCPCPSYPLFDYIALLSGIKLIPYRLDETRNWAIDIDQLEACVSTRTRALVLISPHNPTGHVASAGEIDGLADVARRHELAIISDEVFSDFLLQSGSLPRPAGCAAPLVFTLNGFSKMFALPGLKFGWMAVTGDPEPVRRAMRSLELISDTFLPVNEIVQAAAPEIMKRGRDIRMEFARRIRASWECVEEFLPLCLHCSCVKPQGGFYTTLRLDGIHEERAAEAILCDRNILVSPGLLL